MGQLAGDQELDAGAILDRIRRLARLDPTVFEEVRGAEAQTLPALLVVAVGIVLSALGGWFWLAIEFDGLDTGKIIIREFVLGSVLAMLLWGAWAAITQLTLTNVFGVEADRWALLRCMGYAAAPAALMVALFVPSLSFGIGLASLVAWFVLTNYAIQAAAPSATPTQVVLANMAGFAVFAIALSILADSAGLAPGIFVHGADLGEYIDYGSFGFR